MNSGILSSQTGNALGTVKERITTLKAEKGLQSPVEALTQMLERRPEPNLIMNLMKVKNTLKLQDDDAMWMIFVALQYHLSLYDEIPTKIEFSRKEILKNVEAASEDVIRKNLKEQLKRLHEISGRIEKGFIERISRQAEKLFTEMSQRNEKILFKHVNNSTPWTYTCIGFAGTSFTLAALLSTFIGALIYRPDLLNTLRNIIKGWLA